MHSVTWPEGVTIGAGVGMVAFTVPILVYLCTKRLRHMSLSDILVSITSYAIFGVVGSAVAMCFSRHAGVVIVGAALSASLLTLLASLSVRGKRS